MNSRYGWAVLAVVAGFALASCGGDPTADLADPEEQARPVGLEQVPLEGTITDPAPTYPQYIVYLQPSPSINPLYNDVRKFISTHNADNLAASYPPHVSFTGFFNTSLSQSTLVNRFQAAVNSVATPFGQPTIQAKQGAAPNTSAVSCNFATRLITLHVRLNAKYNTFRANVTTVLGAQQHAKTASHITLFESNNPQLTQARFNSICNAARSFFTPRLSGYNSTSDGNPRWEVTLFRTTHSPSPANPLSQATDVVVGIQVN